MAIKRNLNVTQAIQAQRCASDPIASFWVSASAGTGKTKVLTDRVLSLLINGNDPQKIICLTFTRAAAAEMEGRIFRRLGKWSTINDENLIEDLNSLLGSSPNNDQITRARKLFAIVLESPGGMQIETIHAFCQSLLKRFPLEANLPPHFKLMDERDAHELLVQAREEVLAFANSGRDKTLSDALSVITRHTHEASISNMLSYLTSIRGRLQRLIRKHGNIENTLKHIGKLLKVPEGETSESIVSNFIKSHVTDDRGLTNAAEVLRTGSSVDIQRSRTINQWLNCDNNFSENFESYVDAFLTTTRHKGPIEIRKTLITKNIANNNPSVKNVLEEEAQRLVEIVQNIRSATILETTSALLYFSGALLTSYQKQKEQRVLIDYDDLILEAGNLLNRKGIAPWVLFKLDGGLDHILIDEAQDTSPEQWRVIQTLANEFTAGNTIHQTEPTVFVVGDLKQSIYSFQGADPAEFQAIKTFFKGNIAQAGFKWQEIDLTVSFRSTPAILTAIDSVFKSSEANDGVMLDGNIIEHDAARSGDAGIVELWPPVEPSRMDTLIAWKPPIERVHSDSPPARLARLIAKRIHRMIANEEMLLSQARPIQAGDIMVLVRQRGTFVEELVRTLKSLQVGVSGSDRMVLTEQISVMDLVALGEFLLLPEDDLTLATVLKSPFIGFNEQDLFDLAYNRSGSLWQELKIRCEENETFKKAYEILSIMSSKANLLPPFELYSFLLEAKEGRKKILARLGPDAADPVSEFLNLALAYEQNHAPSLEGFLYWVKSGNVEIKRDLEQARPEAVRIMTVHGAKGLQAPIVFLPDTMQVPSHLPPFFWPQDKNRCDVGFIWPPKRNLFDTFSEKERENAIRQRDQEYRRLLYVAMTRAQDRLYICGWHTKKGAHKKCWYNLIENALSTIGEKFKDPLLADLKETSDNNVLRITSPQIDKIKAVEPINEKHLSNLDQWALTPAPANTSGDLPLIPSQTNETQPSVYSPLGDDNGLRFNRGNIIHKLLQTLPDLDGKSRYKAAQKYLALDTHKLDQHTQIQILEETLTVLNDPEFASIFGCNSRAEVALIGNINGQVISGQIDRLVIEDNRIIIVDYKTNRTPPKNVFQVPETYLRQMSAYKSALQDIYPDRGIECLLLWTDGPSLMRLQTEQLATYSP